MKKGLPIIFLAFFFLTGSVHAGEKSESKHTLEQLIELLGSKSRPTVRAAQQKILKFGTKVVPQLISVVEDRNNKELVRGNTMEVLGDLGDRRAVKPLIKFLEGHPPLLQDRAIVALGKLGAVETNETIGKILRESRYRAIRRNAARSLGMMEKIGLWELKKSLKEKDYHVRDAVAYGLGWSTESEAVDLLIKCLRDGNGVVRNTALGSLVKIGDAAVDPLIKALESKNEDVKVYSVLALAKIGDPKGIDPIIKLLRKEERPDYYCVVTALGSYGKKAVPALIKIFKSDKKPHMRIIAAVLLGQVGDKAAAPVLIDGLKDREQKVRLAAASALGSLGDKSAIKPLIESAQKDEDLKIQLRALDALGKIGDCDATPSLLEFAKTHKHFRIREQAIKSIGKIGDSTASPPLVEMLRNESNLNESDFSIRSYIANALAEIGDPEAVEPLIEYLDDRLIGSDCAKALGVLGDSRAVGPLIGVLKREKSTGNLYAAIKALGKIGDLKAVDPLIELLQDKRFAYNVIKALGNLECRKTIVSLVQLLEDDDGPGFTHALHALANFEYIDYEDEKVTGALIKVLRNKDSKIRYSAHEVLSYLTGWKKLGQDPKKWETYIKEALENNEPVIIRKKYRRTFSSLVHGRPQRLNENQRKELKK